MQISTSISKVQKRWKSKKHKKTLITKKESLGIEECSAMIYYYPNQLNDLLF